MPRFLHLPEVDRFFLRLDLCRHMLSPIRFAGRDLLSGATWSVPEHSLTKWMCINVSDSEGCIDLGGPVPAMPDISPLNL